MSETHSHPRKVKILATLGPASTTPDMVRALLEAGAAGFRLNASHLKPEEIASRVQLVRDAEAALGRPVAVLCDLAGPKLRITKGFPPRHLEAGDTLNLGASGAPSDIPIEGFDPVRDCEVDSRILIHDGKVVIKVAGIHGDHVSTQVVRPGEIGGGMGVNLPDGDTSLPSLTPHDLRCLAAALTHDVDVVALSFVRRASDVTTLRDHMQALGRVVPIVAKLEKSQAVRPESLIPILLASDMVMVARGDLGAETAPERVPVLQKQVLRAARAVGVPVITATEMLESMIHEERPTRAEAADVANAVYDGTDAVLLTAETAMGDHPALAVAACTSIIAEAEAHSDYRANWPCQVTLPEHRDPVSDAVAMAAGRAADQLDAAALVCFTISGRTAHLVARHRPTTPILAITPRPEVARSLGLVWGVTPRLRPLHPDDHEGVVRLAELACRHEALAADGDLIVVTHGAPLGARPSTNLLRVHRVTAAG